MGTCKRRWSRPRGKKGPFWCNSTSAPPPGPPWPPNAKDAKPGPCNFAAFSLFWLQLLLMEPRQMPGMGRQFDIVSLQLTLDESTQCHDFGSAYVFRTPLEQVCKVQLLRRRWDRGKTPLGEVCQLLMATLSTSFTSSIPLSTKTRKPSFSSASHSIASNKNEDVDLLIVRQQLPWAGVWWPKGVVPPSPEYQSHNLEELNENGTTTNLQQHGNSVTRT